MHVGSENMLQLNRGNELEKNTFFVLLYHDIPVWIYMNLFYLMSLTNTIYIIGHST